MGITFRDVLNAAYARAKLSPEQEANVRQIFDPTVPAASKRFPSDDPAYVEELVQDMAGKLSAIAAAIDAALGHSAGGTSPAGMESFVVSKVTRRMGKKPKGRGAK